MTELKYSTNNFGGMYGEKFVTPVFRGAFVNLAKPNTKYERPSWGLNALFPKDDSALPDNLKVTERLKTIQGVCNDLALEYFKWRFAIDKPTMAFDAFVQELKNKMGGRPMFRNGDLKKYEGYPGCWYLVLTNKDINEIKLEGNRQPSEFKPGMFMRAEVSPMIDHQGFSYQLNALRLVGDDGLRFIQKPEAGNLLASVEDALADAMADESIGQGFDSVSSVKSAPSGFDVLG